MAEDVQRSFASDGSDPDSLLPLAGIRMLEFSTAIAGPTCGRYLAALGAEVLKIESWRNPDAVRLLGAGWLPPETDMRVRGDTGPFVGDWNAGKRSVGINTGSPEGRDLILRLAAQADVLLANLAAPVLPAVGLGYEDVRAAKPDIIYLSMPGFGNTPSRYYDFRAWGPNQAPLAGLDHMTGWPDRPPSGIGSFSYPDYTNGAHAAVAITAALLHRDLTGEGQFIDMSQYENTVACIGPVIMAFTANGTNTGRDGNHLPWVAPHGIYPCAGTERWIALACEDDAQWTALCALAADAPFATDPRFATLEGRLAHVDALDAALAAWTRAFTPAELATRLQEHGVPAGIVQDQADQLTDPQLEARGWWTLVPHGRFGVDLTQGQPVHLSVTPPHWRYGSPCFGDGTAYALEELLGLSPEEHRALAERGVVFDPVAPEQRFQRPYLEWIRYVVRSDQWPEPQPQPAPQPVTAK
mgnify:FL=1